MTRPSGAEAYLYVISCRLELAKIGVAGDAEKRLGELQVGSPVELKLTLTRPYADVVARRRNVVRRGQGNDVALRHSSPRNVET